MIALVYPQFYSVGGIARYLDSFLANLPVGHPPVVLITGDEHRCERHYAGVEIIHIPFSSNRFNLIFWSLAVRRKLRELFAADRIRVVNLHWPPLIPGLLLPREIPLVLTAHSTYLGFSGKFYKLPNFKSEWNPISLFLKMKMETWVFRQARKIITLTEPGREQVLAYGFRGDVAVIPNGVDLQRFEPDPSVSKDFDVIFSGRIERLKGCEPMVALCRKLVAQRPQVRICIAGYGDQEAWVRSELSALAANVTMTGKLRFDQMAACYQRSRVYVSTSYYEGLPGTCLEAMAMQLPAVGWDLPFYKGLISEGETGRLVNVDDVEGLSRQIEGLLDCPEVAAEMGGKGRVLLHEKYNWSKLSLDVLKVLEP